MTTIEGVKYSSKEIEGTDLDAVKKFCQKNKVKAAHILYVDQKGNIEHAGIWFNKEASNKLTDYLKGMF